MRRRRRGQVLYRFRGGEPGSVSLGGFPEEVGPEGFDFFVIVSFFEAFEALELDGEGDAFFEEGAVGGGDFTVEGGEVSAGLAVDVAGLDGEAVRDSAGNIGDGIEDAGEFAEQAGALEVGGTVRDAAVKEGDGDVCGGHFVEALEFCLGASAEEEDSEVEDVAGVLAEDLEAVVGLVEGFFGFAVLVEVFAGGGEGGGGDDFVVDEEFGVVEDEEVEEVFDGLWGDDDA